jgi:radical SAM superfamily enzyme YgiQ (UPF0313 family)
MKVLAISANTETINMMTVPIGLMTVVAAARAAGHDVRWLDLCGASKPEDAAISAIARFSPELIAISVRNIDDQASRGRFLLEKVKGVADACRSEGRAPIVLGGAGYSIFPQAALAYLGADYGIQGEGEQAFLTLLERLTTGASLDGVPGLYRREPGPVTARAFANLAALPIPPAETWAEYFDPGPSQWLPFQTRRGCPLDCSYCSTAAIEGRQIRSRPVPAVVAALTSYAAAGFKQIYFCDNTFNLPRGYALDLCRALAAANLGLRWRAIVYPRHVDEELVAAMAAAGCVEASVGFESGCDEILAAMHKRFTAAEAARIVALLADHGIKRMGFLLCGGPGETRATVKRSLAYAESLHLDMLRLSAGIRIYPHTALAKLARQEGIISPDDDLLRPRFYLVPALDGWLQDRIKQAAAARPTWIA